MSVYPGAIKKLIKPGENDPRIHPVGIIFHVAVSEQPSLHGYFDGPSGGIESHFYVRRDGTVEQYRGTNWEADANYKANSFFRDSRTCGFISVETQGMGDGEWTDEQLDSLEALARWASKEHGFRLERAIGPFSDGVGYHTLFPEWTPYAGKTCPGLDRVKQFNTVLMPRLREPENPTRVERANALLEAAQKRAVRVGNDKRAASLDKKIKTGPKK